MQTRTRIAIADDHPLFREGVSRTISSAEDFEVVAECGDANAAVQATVEYNPDIVLLDISMPGNGIDAVRRIREISTSVKIVMLTVSEHDEDVLSSLKMGACGYIVKGIGGARLIEAIRSIASGEFYVSSALAGRILVNMQREPKISKEDPFVDLNMREKRVLELVSEGLSNREIAEEENLSEKTIKYYMTNVLQKLQVRNRVEAAIKVREFRSGN
jgi:two-component system nitrate/nitrite response regulator NarL